jgi:hypothetical protein
MRKCFFVTPIGDKGSEVRIHSDQVLKHLLKPVCSELNLEVIREPDDGISINVK